jgi:hypothetical protein
MGVKMSVSGDVGVSLALMMSVSTQIRFIIIALIQFR